jgi:hypothetical protein
MTIRVNGRGLFCKTRHDLFKIDSSIWPQNGSETKSWFGIDSSIALSLGTPYGGNNAGKRHLSSTDQ